MKYLKLHKINTKLQSLCDDMHLLSDKELGDHSEAVDSIKLEFLIVAEKRCHTFRSGTVDYSPYVIQRKKKGYVWSSVVKKLEGKVVNTAYIFRLEHLVEIPSPLLVSLEKAKETEKQYYDRFDCLKPDAPAYQHRFLSKQMFDAIVKGGRKKTIEPKNIILREDSREMWKIIRAARSPSAGQSVLSVTTQIEGVVHECTSQDDV